MKKFLALVLAVLMTVTVFAGCGSDKGDGSTLMFDYKDLSKYVEMPEYKGIKVSADDEEFVKLLSDQMANDLYSAGFVEKVEVASGNVENGDTVHITYVGTHNGVAFSGGSTGDEGTDLVIGSGTYIDGFEEGLIGAAVGETVVLDLTFPDPYPNNTDLSGEKVQFTVNVESITREKYPEITDEIAKKMGYDNTEAYNQYAFVTAVQAFLYNKITTDAKVLEVPQTELDYYIEMDLEYYKSYAEQVGYTFEDFLAAYSMDEEAFKQQLSDMYSKNMSAYMAIYYIAREEGLTVDSEAIEAEYKSLAEENEMEVDKLKEEIDDKQIEYSLLYDNVLKFVYDNAEIEK